MRFDVKDNRHTQRDEDRGEGRWDYSWSEGNDYYYEAVREHTNDVWSSDWGGDVSLFPNEVEPQDGDTVYIVGVSYNTGDSFGNGSNYHCLLWAFTNKAKADELDALVREDAKKTGRYKAITKPLNFYGAPISTYEWKGYFESFNHSFVEEVKFEK